MKYASLIQRVAKYTNFRLKIHLRTSVSGVAIPQPIGLHTETQRHSIHIEWLLECSEAHQQIRSDH